MGKEAKPPLPTSVPETATAEHKPAVPANGSPAHGSEWLFRELLENANDMIYTQDLSGQFTWINKATTDLTGYTLEEARAMRMQDIVAREHWPVAEEQARRKQTGDQARTTYEVDLVTKSGERLAVEVSTRLIYQQGKATGVQGMVRDISSRKRAEHNLQIQRAYLEQLFESSPEAVVLLDNDFRVLRTNREFANLFGYTSEEAAGRLLNELVIPPSRQQESAQLRERGSRGERINLESTRCRKDGTLVHVSIMSAPVVVGGKLAGSYGIYRDISAQKRTEQALARNEQRFRSLVQNTSDVITVVDSLGKITYESPAVERVFGYKAEERIGTDAFALVHADDLEAVRADFQRITKGTAKSNVLLFRGRHKAGTWRHVELTVTNLLTDPTVSGVVMNTRDVTERRQTERALQSSEQKLLLHLQQSLLGVIEWNTNFEIVEWNEAAEKIFGYPAAEAIGRHGSFIVPKAASERVNQVWSDLLKQRGGTRSANENVRKDGRIILCEWLNTPLVDSQGRVMAVASLVQDVTERKHAEEALRISEERYRLLFERNLAGVYWTTIDGEFVDCNETFARMFGYASRFEVLGISADELFRTASERKEYLRRLREHKTLTNLEWQSRRKDGSPIWILENVSLVEQDGNQLIQGTLIDITERKQAEEAMRQAEQKYRSIFENAAEGIFQTSLDGRWLTVNPPLAAILGYESTQELMQTNNINKNFYVQPGRRAELIHAVAGGELRAVESQVYRKDGKTIWIQESARAVRDQHGKLIGFEGTLQDVTERKEAEAALQASRKFIERIADSSPNILYLYDLRERRLVYANSQLPAILGYSLEQTQHMGESFLEDMMHPEDAALMAARGNPFVDARDGDILESEYRVRHANAEWRWFHSRDTVFTRDEQGKPQQILGAAEDITERKLAESALRSSERRLRKQNQALVELAQRKVVERGDLAAAVQQISEATAGTLEVSRARVWFYNDDRSLLHCIDDFDRATGKHSSGLQMMVKDYPAYFHALGRERAIAAHDAFLDARTRELLPKYLKPSGITSRLDATIRVGGRVVGVVSHEHAGPARQWTLDEENFAGSMADLVSLAIEASERKRAEVALRESESKFRAVAETAASGIYIHQGERFLYCNRATELISGYTRQELFKLSPFELVHPDDREFVRQRFKQREAGTLTSPRYEYRIVTKGGETRWLDFSGTLVQFEGQMAVLATAFDVTERKRSEQIQAALYRIAEKTTSVQNLDEFYRAMHGILSELIYASNFYIALYDAREDLIGAPSVDWLGVPLLNNGHAFGVLAIQSYTENVRFTEREQEILTFVSQHVGTAILRRRNEEALRASEARYRSQVQSAVYGIYRSSMAEDRFLDVNPALIGMLGYESLEEVLALRLTRDVYVDASDRLILLKEYRRKPLVEGVDVRWKRKDGKNIIVRISGRAILNAAGDAESFEMIAEDTTERRALEDQLRQSQKMEAVGRLAGGVAHDFNNLLTVIKGYSELMLDQIQPADPLRSEVEEVKKAADRAAALTRQLLAFSRKQVLAPKIIDLNAVTTNVERLLQRLLGEDIDFVTALEPSLGRVKADPGQIEQVIMNLAVNARDAMPSGGKLTISTSNVTLDETFSHDSKVAPGPYVLLSVTDTGVGMDADTKLRIFEPFFTTKEQGKGTGLGLSTVYGIVKQSGGYISVYSEAGLGTSFKVYLPRLDAAAEAPAAASGSRLQTGTETILLVEDEDGVRALTRQLLQKQGYSVLETRHGGEALLLCERHQGRIQLLLTDVVLNSGTAFLQKPFTAESLSTKVREVLDSPQAKAAAN